jgi:hypothetical protein
MLTATATSKMISAMAKKVQLEEDQFKIYAEVPNR